MGHAVHEDRRKRVQPVTRLFHTQRLLRGRRIGACAHRRRLRHERCIRRLVRADGQAHAAQAPRHDHGHLRLGEDARLAPAACLARPHDVFFGQACEHIKHLVIEERRLERVPQAEQDRQPRVGVRKRQKVHQQRLRGNDRVQVVAVHARQDRLQHRWRLVRRKEALRHVGEVQQHTAHGRGAHLALLVEHLSLERLVQRAPGQLQVAPVDLVLGAQESNTAGCCKVRQERIELGHHCQLKEQARELRP